MRGEKDSALWVPSKGSASCTTRSPPRSGIRSLPKRLRSSVACWASSRPVHSSIVSYRTRRICAHITWRWEGSVGSKRQPPSSRASSVESLCPPRSLSASPRRAALPSSPAATASTCELLQPALTWPVGFLSLVTDATAASTTSSPSLSSVLTKSAPRKLAKRCLISSSCPSHSFPSGVSLFTAALTTAIKPATCSSGMGLLPETPTPTALIPARSTAMTSPSEVSGAGASIRSVD
mmetsp:Transcript_44869/g.105254  ORF Transcript_44869/g.105254 Transcript_44869/m.105254 type:complete len:236 (-) Transcript_44869:274-981(-)